jgi:predicted GH43/DUF377 family glycosyl hydrolase
MNINMQAVVEKYITPYKFGKPVLTGSGASGEFDSLAVDVPFVFYHNNKFHMMYVGFDGDGYQTGLAESDDLMNWKKKGVILKREDNVGWDRVGAAGTWMVKNTNNLYELPTLKKIDNKYWLLYHSYPEKGYETGAAKMGLAWTEDEELLDWHRLPEPVFTWEEGENWERGGLYKGCLIEEKGIYYLFYNAKNETFSSWKEQTGVAVSSDMFNWKRYEGNPVLRVPDEGWNSKFCSDPYVVKDNGLWLMFFFGYDGVHAQDGIAISEDLLRWEMYPVPILCNGSKGEIDESHAHKPSMIYYNGILYHFYCACRRHNDGDPSRNLGDEFRCITAATSKPLWY